MATPFEVLKSQIGVLADPIAAYIAAVLADASATIPEPEEPPVVTPPPTDASGIILEVVSNDPYGKIRIVSDASLMKGERALLEDCIANGIDVYLFGMGDGFGSGNAHNIELKTSSIDNTNMLNLAIEMAKK